MKTAAQKRAEKKERDKKKKELQKAEARNRRMKEKPKDGGGNKDAVMADDEQDVTSTADAAQGIILKVIYSSMSGVDV